MKSKLFIQALIFSVLVAAAGAIFYISGSKDNLNEMLTEQLVSVSEIKTLVSRGDAQLASQRLDELDEQLRKLDVDDRRDNSIAWICLICAGFIFMNAAYTYFAVLRPFSKLEKYASQLAAGNFDIPLEYERKNYFGKFTWAFDSMRREISAARAGEKQAVENNKTVIATLSHDIKTPVASIRAYCEGLEAHLDTSPEKRRKYLEVIMRKCDEVSKLTNDLFIHSLSDLEKLDIKPVETDICELLLQTVTELDPGGDEIHCAAPDKPFVSDVDPDRLKQVFENIITNARKYAKTEIDVALERDSGTLAVRFTDHGGGIPDEDMAFVTDKFYRGHNCRGEPGSGLGLYICSYLCRKMNALLSLRNTGSGLEVTVTVKEISASETS
ncbi:HAMP domain-containing sensor histidine kinase [Ruminococcus sp. FC2018]|uniref:HAMP domain-containing sensor histidine kinase n=1 Tax=Ruminococcus sp. FC2018 TaxID=1410617 RepID=UPI000491B0B1|nr:HAMP domain-containing sensor histidine kinase [Ruminococcus sp. FC2018]